MGQSWWDRLKDWLGLTPAEPEGPLPRVPRRLLVRAATAQAVVGWVAEYGALHQGSDEVAVTVVGSQAGWTAVVLPDDLHPWHAHNLAMWLGGEATSEAVPRHEAVIAWAQGTGRLDHVLLPDPRRELELEGWRADGVSVATFPRTGVWFEGEDVSVPPGPPSAQLDRLGVPEALRTATSGEVLTLTLRPPDRWSNGTLTPTASTRAEAREGGGY